MELKVPNLGLPIGNSCKSGDLYIKLSIILPELSTSEINQLKMIDSFNNNIDCDINFDINFDRLINL
jgi:DnaJ-class molecular chaperone